MWSTPEWRFEYDARQIYDPASKWGKNDPLNGTFWHAVTNNMLSNASLVSTYNFLETKVRFRMKSMLIEWMSVVTKNSTSPGCVKQKVCYIRSGSAALGTACGSSSGRF